VTASAETQEINAQLSDIWLAFLGIFVALQLRNG
jgi:hypothetical protein